MLCSRRGHALHFPFIMKILLCFLNVTEAEATGSPSGQRPLSPPCPSLRVMKETRQSSASGCLLLPGQDARGPW